jgi:hypothetical protein
MQRLLQSPTTKSANKSRRLGFIRARRQIKAFLSRKGDSLQSDSEEERPDDHSSPPTAASTPVGSKKVKTKPKNCTILFIISFIIPSMRSFFSGS